MGIEKGLYSFPMGIEKGLYSFPTGIENKKLFLISNL